MSDTGSLTLNLGNPMIRHLASAIGLVSVIIGVLWFIGEPRAQRYIREQIVAENAELKKSIEEANRNVDKTRKDLRALRRKSDQAQSDLTTIKELGKEQRQLLYRLLQQRTAN